MAEITQYGQKRLTFVVVLQLKNTHGSRFTKKEQTNKQAKNKRK